MRVMQVSVCIGLIGCVLAAPTQASAQGEEKVGRRGLPFFGVKRIDQALKDPKATAERREATGKETPDQIEFASIMSMCSDAIRWQEVELYDGRFGPTVTTKFVLERQPAAAQIQWKSDLGLTPPDGNPGNVAGERWCTGTLIAPNQFLTAAHCFEPKNDPQGWQTPQRRVRSGSSASWKLLTAQELAPLMLLNFNYQVDGNDVRHRVRPAVSFPIVKLLEYGFEASKSLDYAIIELGRNPAGRLPSDIFAITAIDATDAGLAAANVLTILQHPAGEPKKIMAGPKKETKNEWLYYSDLDTIGGSSGSGVLAETGKVIAVHTNGGCTKAGGANRGVTLQAIKTVSQIIK
jgi:hypothetical protein